MSELDSDTPCQAGDAARLLYCAVVDTVLLPLLAQSKSYPGCGNDQPDHRSRVSCQADKR